MKADMRKTTMWSSNFATNINDVSIPSKCPSKP